MKKIQWIFSSLLVLFFLNTAQAQILKKIQRAVENKVERKAVNKVSEKTEKITSDSIDKVLDPEDNFLGYGKNKVNPSVVPDFYQFSWKYSLEIQADKEKAMIIDYFLEPNAAYFGLNTRQSNEMFMIMDLKNKLMITCFNQGHEKVATASKIPDYSGTAEKESNSTKFSYKTLPNKIFMGYNCKGIEATNENYVMVFYYTNDAKVSFSDISKSQQNHKMPDAFKNYFKYGDNPLMMTMDIIDLKNNRKTTSMKCVGLEKNPYTFAKSEYKFM